MNGKNSKKRLATFALAALFVGTGTYNAVVINSDSVLSSADVKFVKRLDEIYGVTIPGRKVAATTTWKKISPTLNVQKTFAVTPSVRSLVSAPSQVPAPSESAGPETQPEAAVQEELNLSLVEVINPKKWEKGLTNTQFSGSLSTNSGVIESLSVSLPNGEGVSVSFSEMTGNVFEYDLSGELYSGMMYQVDQNAYMVTLTNGPLEGTRLRFSAQPTEEQIQEVQDALAANNIEVASFGNTEISQETNPEEILQNDQAMQQEAIQAQGFNLSEGQQQG
jgi:hypothetical protein